MIRCNAQKELNNLMSKLYYTNFLLDSLYRMSTTGYFGCRYDFYESYEINIMGRLFFLIYLNIYRSEKTTRELFEFIFNGVNNCET